MRFVLGAVVVLALVSGCTFKLGAEKLNAEARTARKVHAPVDRIDVTSARHDEFLIRKAFV